MMGKLELDDHIKNNPLLYKSFLLALEIIKIYKVLTNEKHEYIMSKQLLKAGTSVGANCNEAVAGQSKKDFIAKLSIARKEGYETKYWLDLLKFSDYLSSPQTQKAYNLLDECMRLICSSINTSKKTMK
jgi:four helix bundle protein